MASHVLLPDGSTYTLNKLLLQREYTARFDNIFYLSSLQQKAASKIFIGLKVYLTD